MQHIGGLLLTLVLAVGPVAATAETSASPASPDAPADLNPELQALAAEFFAWRAAQQPVTGDDVNRVERPEGWVPAFTPTDLALYRFRYREFLERLAKLDTGAFSRADEVDARLLESAISRVGWELDVLRSPHRNPWFYLDQTLGSVFELLVLSSPMNAERLSAVILRLQQFPVTVASAKANLEEEAVQPFAIVAIEGLQGIEEKLSAMQAALEPFASPEQLPALASAVEQAAAALADYREWLTANLSGMGTEFSIGTRKYQWFLTNVALVPYTPDELVAMGRAAWNRAVVFDTLEQNRVRDIPPLPVFATAGEQIATSFRHEQDIRAFLERQGLMTVPDWLMHYRNRLMPDYLLPLSFMGVTDDLTSESRLHEDAVSYILPPADDLPFFGRSAAMDPRPLIIHEGVPGHYYQLARSWAHPDPIRRRYFDSGANEGIGFYVEELLQQAGLFAFSPRTTEIIYQFMRLRALRVEVDIRLATGEFTVEQASEYLERTVPMDHATAASEAVFFAFNPGQAITYQIGKLQIERFLSDARLDKGEEFSLREFHDRLMENGNVPIALQRWEYLGRGDDMQRLRELDDQVVTVPD